MYEVLESATAELSQW